MGLFVRYLIGGCLLTVLVVFWPLTGRAGESLCGAFEPPDIQVTVWEEDVVFDVTRTKENLASEKIDTKSPYPHYFRTEIGGLMKGRLMLDHKIRLNRHINGKTRKACLQLNEIEVTLRLAPEIHIAEEYGRKSCWFREVFQHEAKHIDVDRAVIDRYKKIIKDGLKMVYREPADYTSGVVPVEKLAITLRDMNRTLEAALGVLFESLMQERLAKQQQVDNIHEYRSVRKRC